VVQRAVAAVGALEADGEGVGFGVVTDPGDA